MAFALLQLLSALKREGIRVVPLKGLILASMSYGDEALRTIGDIDLLVQTRDFARACKVLSSRALSEEVGLRRVERLPSDGQAEFWVCRCPDKSGLLVELKSQLVWAPRACVLESLIWPDLRPYSFGDIQVEVLSPELTILHLALHMMEHLYSLKWLVDLAQTMGRFDGLIDWNKVRALARSAGCQRIVSTATRTAQRLQRAPFHAEDLCRDFHEEPLALWFKPPNPYLAKLYRLFAWDGVKEQMSFALRQLLIARPALQRHHPLNFRFAGPFLTGLLRPLILAGRLTWSVLSGR